MNWALCRSKVLGNEETGASCIVNWRPISCRSSRCRNIGPNRGGSKSPFISYSIMATSPRCSQILRDERVPQTL
jgi:hypothetical protein